MEKIFTETDLKIEAQPLVTIVTPTYNHERFIGACIQSVLDQVYLNWEMIIVNDGSTDNTLKIANEFAVKDSRVKVIDQENVGIFKLDNTYNKALSVSKGSLVAILEGDDYWEPEKLEEQVNIFVNYEVVLCWCSIYTRVEDQKNVLRTQPDLKIIKKEWLRNEPKCSALNVFLRNTAPPVGWMINRKALDSVGGFIQAPNFPAIDMPTAMELAKLGKFYFIEKPLGTWRTHKNQVTKNLTTDMNSGTQEYVETFYSSLTEQQQKNTLLSKSKIKSLFKTKKIVALSRSGRFRLIRKEYKSARKDYWASIKIYGLTAFDWKIRSIVGIIASWFHTDVEYLAKKIGKGSVN